jgi:hypothetical protein
MDGLAVAAACLLFGIAVGIIIVADVLDPYLGSAKGATGRPAPMRRGRCP